MSKIYIKRKQCIICGKKLSIYSTLHRPNAKYCIKHRNQYLNSLYTKNSHHTEETKQLLRLKALKRNPTRNGAILTIKTKKQISNSLKKYYKNNPDKIRRGKFCHLFGTVPNWKKIRYKNIWMRSSWEVKYAKWLDKNKIKWLYESKTFDLGKTTYTPDFYLSKTKEYIEIKGYFRKKDRYKICVFKIKFPKEKITILRKKELKKLNLL